MEKNILYYIFMRKKIFFPKAKTISWRYTCKFPIARVIFLSYPRRLYHGISHSVINPACEIAHTRLCEIRDLSGTIDFYPPISVEPRGHGFSSHGGNRWYVKARPSPLKTRSRSNDYCGWRRRVGSLFLSLAWHIKDARIYPTLPLCPLQFSFFSRHGFSSCAVVIPTRRVLSGHFLWKISGARISSLHLYIRSSLPQFSPCAFVSHIYIFSYTYTCWKLWYEKAWTRFSILSVSLKY